jgi:hypothetical protein
MNFLTTAAGVIGTSLSVLFFELLFCFMIIASLISLGLFVLWIITLVDCVRRDKKNFAFGGKDAKVLWILLLVFFRKIVPIIYYFLIMYKKSKKSK